MYAAGKKFTNSFGMNNWLPSFKQEFPYLCDSPSQTLQQVTKDLGGAYKNFFEKRADFPQFKKKGVIVHTPHQFSPHIHPNSSLFPSFQRKRESRKFTEDPAKGTMKHRGSRFRGNDEMVYVFAPYLPNGIWGV